MNVGVFSETAPLVDVVMADISVFHLTEPINLTQEKYYQSAPPILEFLIDEQSQFTNALSKENVQIHWAKSLPNCPYQHATRDIGVVVGNTFVFCRMRKSIREGEKEGLKEIIDRVQMQDRVTAVESGYIEGGDILIDGHSVFVGLSQRTDENGLRSFSKIIDKDFEVIPLRMKDRYLHLDTVLNLLPQNVILAYRNAFDTPLEQYFSKDYQIIEVTSEEQELLFVNALTISPNTVCVDQRASRINSLLRETGLKLYELECTETTKIGRSFRCCTLPMYRC